MKSRKIKSINTPYKGITSHDYQIEKRRLQVELLNIQQRVIKHKERLAIIFEGRDAAGKGSTIKRFTEYLMPSFYKVVELGIPTKKESKYWFKRYEKRFPREKQIVFFDRSWYNRALIEPTMGYCKEKQYLYFMKKVLKWEHKQINNNLILVKFYLSIDKDTQLYRFEDRLQSPLTYWKFSDNDLQARNKWKRYTQYKEQMYAHTSSDLSPWVVINANKKREARLTTMLYLVQKLGNKKFKPLTGEDVTKVHTIHVDGVKFRGLNLQQLAVLKELKDQEYYHLKIDEEK